MLLSRLLANFGSGSKILSLCPKDSNYRKSPDTQYSLYKSAMVKSLVLMGVLKQCWLPSDHRSAMRLLGNGIASQHALLASGNGLAYLRDLTPVEVQELIVEALRKRMTATNIRCIEEDYGTQFGIDEFACRPTLAMHGTKDIILKCPTETIRFQSERGGVVLECLQLVTGDAMPSSVSLLPGGDVNTRVSLPFRYEVKAF